MRFEELYATSASQSRAPDAAPAPLRVRPPAPETAPELHAVLAAFASRAQGLRQQVARGGTMPAAQVENWEQVTFALDGFLSRPAAPRVGSGDLLQAQSVLEAELERDGSTYGDMPAPLAEAVVLRVGRLALRTAELRRLEQPPEPAEEALPRFSWPVDPVSVTSLFLLPLALRDRRAPAPPGRRSGCDAGPAHLHGGQGRGAACGPQWRPWPPGGGPA